MHSYAGKSQQSRSKAVRHSVIQKQSGGESVFQFVNRRAEAITQGKQQAMAENNPQIKQLHAYQEMANNCLQAKQGASVQTMADNYSAQHQLPIQKKENKTGLPDKLKTGVENLSGYSMDDVKVHYNSNKPAQLQAHAYAQGTNIHLGPGQERHLPHEAWHVVQQKQGRVKPTMQMQGASINDDGSLEREADLMGGRALQMKVEGERKARYDSYGVNNGNLSIQLYATLDDVKKTGEKILGHKVELLDEEAEQNQAPTQKMVAQRLINAPVSLNNPYTFQVEPGDIGTGTATTPATRAFVNGPGAPLAPTATFSYGFFPGGGAWIAGAAPGPLNIAPNPPPLGGNYDAGHALGRQNGGLGHVNAWVFPQDRNVNRGWAGTFPLWRAHENAFRAGVAALPPGGFGIWHVTLP